MQKLKQFAPKAKKPWLTYIFIATAVIVYILETLWARQYGEFFVQDIFKNYGFSLSGLIEGRWWTFFTSIFLHSGFDHLLMNMAALFFFGTHLEKKVGSPRFALIFFLTAIGGDLAIAASSLAGAMPANIPTVGASAAIFGVMGAGMIINPFEIVMHPYLVPVPFLLVAIVYAIYNITAFAATIATGIETNVAYIAHLGGILVGAAYGFRHESRAKGAVVVLAIFILLLVLPTIVGFLEQFNYIKILESFFNR